MAIALDVHQNKWILTLCLEAKKTGRAVKLLGTTILKILFICDHLLHFKEQGRKGIYR